MKKKFKAIKFISQTNTKLLKNYLYYLYTSVGNHIVTTFFVLDVCIYTEKTNSPTLGNVSQIFELIYIC